MPHDWGIEGDFAEENDPAITIVKEDGVTKERIMTDWNGGLPVVGMGVDFICTGHNPPVSELLELCTRAGFTDYADFTRRF